MSSASSSVGAGSKIHFALGQGNLKPAAPVAAAGAQVALAPTPLPGSVAAVSSAGGPQQADGPKPAASSVGGGAVAAGRRPLEIESRDVVRLIEQFLKENGLTRTLRTLQEESGVAFNAVDSVERFVADIIQGRWDKVLEATSLLALPATKLIDLYEHVVLELVEAHELDAAQALLQAAPVFAAMRSEDPERVAQLDRVIQQRHAAAGASLGAALYPAGVTREGRRQALAVSLRREVSAAPPSRLLSLLAMALKWQAHTGRLSLASAQGLDLLLGAAPVHASDEDRAPSSLARAIKMGSGARAEVAAFSPDGAYLATGASDGFVEVYDVDSGQLATSLAYQAQEEFLMHDKAVTALAFSRECAFLASGSVTGEIKVWRFETGECLHRIPQAHAQTVTALEFSPDSLQLLSASQDSTAKIHGLKSGRLLKEFRGHVGFVSAAVFSEDASQVVTGGSDGLVRVWNVKTGECSAEIALDGQSTAPVPVLSMSKLPLRPDALLVATRGPHLRVLLPKSATVMQTYTVPASAVGPLPAAGGAAAAGASASSSSTASSSSASAAAGAVAPTLSFAVCSARGRLIYAASALDATVYCFAADSGRLVHAFRAHAAELTGLIHHPSRSVCGTLALDATVKLWK